MFGALVSLLLLNGCDPERRQARKDLRHERDAVRELAVIKLVRIEGAEAIPTVGRLLSDPSVRVRRAVVKALRGTRSKKALPFLFTALRDVDPEIRLAAVRGLGELRDRSAIDPLLLRLSDPKPLIRRAARFALDDLKISGPERVKLLARREMARCISSLRTRNSQVRRDAALKMGQSGRKGALPHLLLLLGDSNPEVVEAAAKGLGMLSLPESRKALLRAKKEPIPEIRKAALMGLSLLFEGYSGACAEKWTLDFLGVDTSSVHDALVTRLLECAENKELRIAVPSRPLCRMIEEGSLKLALKAAKLLNKIGGSCDSTSMGPLQRALMASVSGKEPQAEDLKKLAMIYRSKLPSYETAAFLADLKAPEIRAALLSLARDIYARYLFDTEKWLSEEQWRKLEAESKGGGKTGVPEKRTKPAAEARNMAGPTPSAKTQRRGDERKKDDKKRKLTALLSRFPLRPVDEQVELLPPRTGFAQVRRALNVAGLVKEGFFWLTSLVLDGPDAIRSAALNAMALRAYESAPPPKLVQAVRKGLSGDSHNRIAAVRVLGRLGRYGVVIMGQILANDPNPVVRSEAAFSLGLTGLPEARAPLRKALRVKLDLAVVQAIGKLSDPEAVPVLLWRLKQNPTLAQTEERLALIEALGSTGNPTAETVAALIEELDHPNTDLRKAAAVSLGKLRSRRAIEALTARSEDYYADVRRACRSALKKIEKEGR